jgi:hypothetical protein
MVWNLEFFLKQVMKTDKEPRASAMKTMTVAVINDLLHPPKFKPLTLLLDDGTKIPVKHSDFVMFTEGKKTIIITEGEHIHIADVERITAIEARR